MSAVLAVAFVGTAVSQEFSQDAKESYSLGASLGNYLSSQAYKQSELGVPVNMDQVMEGLTDALKNKSKLTEEEIIAALNTRAEKLNKLHEARVKQVKEKNKAESEAYLAKNKARKGVKQLESGLQYEELQAGTGAAPKEEDIVTMPVPPESALIFEVTLKKVEKPGANKSADGQLPAGHPKVEGNRPKMAWPHG